MEAIDTVNLALVPAVTILVEAFKAFGVPSKAAPIIAIIAGIVGVGIFSGFSLDSALIGLVTGLSASGLYSGVVKTNILKS